MCRFERLCGATVLSKLGRGDLPGSVCGRDAASKPTGMYSRRLPGKSTGGGLRPYAHNWHQHASAERREQARMVERALFRKQPGELPALVAGVIGKQAEPVASGIGDDEELGIEQGGLGVVAHGLTIEGDHFTTGRVHHRMCGSRVPL